jgi:hypothetical protein
MAKSARPCEPTWPARASTDVMVHDRSVRRSQLPALARRRRTSRPRRPRHGAGLRPDRDLVISAVTAGQALNVARAAHRTWEQPSSSTSTRSRPRRARRRPIAGQRRRALCRGCGHGPHRAQAATDADPAGRPCGGGRDANARRARFRRPARQRREVGRASAVKLSRSIFVKGSGGDCHREPGSARHFGVEAEVLASLENTLPHPDWPGLARYLITRPLVHGQRRSEEMVEAAAHAGRRGTRRPMTAPWSNFMPARAPLALARRPKRRKT